MANPRPVGMRIPRPYATEQEFIRGDGLAIGRLGMILIGAPKRPPGITIRFEVVLEGGEPVFRGEGRVVAHRIHANGREGLEIRFTRLDSRSKALVEQVLKLRRSGALTPLSATNPPPPKPDDAPSAKVQPAADASEPEAERRDTAPTEAPPPESQDEQPEVASTAGPAGDVQHAPAHEVLDSSELSPVEGEEAADRAQHEPPQPGPEDAAAVAAVATVAEVEPEEEIEEVEPEEEIEEVEPVEEIEGVGSVEADHEVPDEDPTPFAPPVTFEEERATDPSASPGPGVATAAPEPVSVSADVASALSKLRERATSFDAPESPGAVLARLRNRAKAL